MSVQQAHLCAAFDATHDGFENRRESHCAQSGRASDDRESIQRCWGGVRMQAGDSDECTDRAPAMSAADEGCTARHQRQHLRAQYRVSFTIGLSPLSFPRIIIVIAIKGFSCQEARCICSQAACKSCQSPTPCSQIHARPKQPWAQSFRQPSWGMSLYRGLYIRGRMLSTA